MSINFGTDALTRVLAWEDKVHNLILEDNVYQSCALISKVLLINALKRGFGVIFLTFNQSPEELKRSKLWNQPSIKIIDGIDDPFDAQSCSQEAFHEKIIAAIEEHKQEGRTNSVVFINSVDSLMTMVSSPLKLCTSISPLVQGRLVLIYHGDTNPSIHKDLVYLCGTHLSLRNAQRQLIIDTQFIDNPGYITPYSYTNCPDANLVDLVHRLPSGKVSRERAVLKIDIDSNLACNITYSPYTNPNDEPLPEATESEKKEVELPTDISTFNLNLTDKQREARDDLVLPYLSGTIMYHPDDGDDFDEDDPDDDLEI
ncbi:Elongator complex protein [Entomophthora muscae]|uniref:Elongator complex protein n=1 Tax=Entomophthora muscae TaxID=34485 RepID=A0ACC2TMU0_9FUNG|nr:Elongator complex protein [Entomophthora muscae]